MSSIKTTFTSGVIMRKRYIILFGVIYTVIYLYLAIDLAGAGHGTLVFLTPLITWIFIFVALYLLTRLENSIVRVFFVVLMLMHYAITLFFLRGYSLDIDTGLLKMWERHPNFILFTIAWYLLGQIMIWVAFLKVKSRKNELL